MSTTILIHDTEYVEVHNLKDCVTVKFTAGEATLSLFFPDHMAVLGIIDKLVYALVRARANQELSNEAEYERVR